MLVIRKYWAAWLSENCIAQAAARKPAVLFTTNFSSGECAHTKENDVAMYLPAPVAAGYHLALMGVPLCISGRDRVYGVTGAAADSTACCNAAGAAACFRHS